VRSAARASGWQTRRAASAARTTGVASGQGIATVLYEGDNGYCALVAEVDVHTDSGEIRVKRFVIANDSGPVSNPDGLRNQLEGGALHGLSRTLTEEVTWDETWVTSVDWRSYRPLFLGSGIPKIETVLINRPDERAMGAGETAVTLVAAAVGNAVFDATGVRLRQVPFTPARVKTALSSRK
jgi:CO/xanthine dehydrogenase Mo-binding subunit